ncbi:MAG: hypothetical protein ABMA14_22750 [Hyphomonadaceae bacterium]
MRVILVLIVILGLVAAGGYFTRPAQGLHRGVASVLMAQGKTARPDAATGKYAFDDFFVATRSTMTSGDREVLQCWGAFTRFLCTGAPPLVQAPAVG